MNNIKKWRAIRNMTQTELSNKCNLARTYISFLEQSDPRRKLTKDTIEKLTRCLNCSAPELLGEDLFYYLPENDKERIDTMLILINSIENADLKQKLLEILG